MTRPGLRSIAATAFLALVGPGFWRDPSSHAVRFVTVEPNVRTEAHYHQAPCFRHDPPRVRRFSFCPSANALDRLRDDVLAVIEALQLTSPVLVGHSIAGAELSAVAVSHPDRVAALIYLEAALNDSTERQATALERGVPTARVRRMRGAHHIFLSNEAETLRAMQAFLAGVK